MIRPDQESDLNSYIAAVLKIYLELPETPLRAGPQDRRMALDLYEKRIPLSTVEAALLLVSIRRLGRPPDYPPLSPIRSLAYFKPTVEELLENPIPDGYLEYLRKKARILAERKQVKRCG